MSNNGHIETAPSTEKLGLTDENKERLTELFLKLEDQTDAFEGRKDDLAEILETESDIKSIILEAAKSPVTIALAREFHRVTGGPGLTTQDLVFSAIQNAIEDGKRTCALTEDFIAHRLAMHYNRHGKRPMIKSDPVDGLPGQKWSGWASALKGNKQLDGSYKSIRGLPGGSSLTTLHENPVFLQHRMAL